MSAVILGIGGVPSVIVEIDGLAPAVSMITVERYDGATWSLVRGAIRASTVGAFTVGDWECPFNIEVTYRAQLFNAAGISLGFETVGSITLESSETWIHNPLAPSGGVAVSLTDKAAEDFSRPHVTDLVYPIGRPQGISVGSGRRGLQGFRFEVMTETFEDADKVQALLGSDDAPLVPVLCIRRAEAKLRTPRTLFLHVPDIVEIPVNVRFGGEMNVQSMVGSEASPPAPQITQPLVTRGDLSAFYATRGARSADNATRLAASRRYDLAGYAHL